MSQQLNLENKNERKELSIKIKNNINKFTEKLQRHSNRLPASLMGETCLRKLWYVFRWVKLEHFDGRMQRLFDVGNYAEPRFINYLEGIGFKVWPVDPQTNEQWSIKALNGHYGGKSDEARIRKI